jgi:tetratricopeptide (TPR) repeat protein
MAKPICFMVMPFGTKPVEPRVEGAPEKIDFDALWNKAYLPVIATLGYEPVRADQDTGASIILEMLERLFFSDLVVADMTVPNGNVYYEVGIRHASRPTGCVLVSADWSRPLFDVNQMRRLTFPLSEGTVTDETAEKVRVALERGARALADGTSPMYAHIPGFPDPRKVDPTRAQAIRDQLEAIAAFQSRVREARLVADRARKAALALALRDENPASRPISQAVALELVMLLRDCVGWRETVEYIDALPPSVRDLDVVQEQRALAHSKSGDHELAIAALEQLVARRGDTSERRGLIGGRYKKLADAARAAGDTARARDLLDLAIEQYERGMRLDLNDFYPPSNLPFLYRERGEPGDEPRAAVAAQVARLAAERDAENDWSRPTLLTLAFFDQDVARARAYAKEVRRAGPGAWQLASTVTTLERSVGQTPEPATRAALQGILDELKALLV